MGSDTLWTAAGEHLHRPVGSPGIAAWTGIGCRQKLKRAGNEYKTSARKRNTPVFPKADEASVTRRL